MNVWMKKERFHFAALKNIWFQLGFTENLLMVFLADSEIVKNFESK